MSSCFRIRSVEPLGGSQIILWLEDEATHAEGPGDGTLWCVRVTLPDAGTLVADLLAAYTKTWSDLAVNLAAGGCRTCGGSRRVGTNPFAALTGGDPGGEPCPVCVPRAERRLRERVMGMRRRAS